VRLLILWARSQMSRTVQTVAVVRAVMLYLLNSVLIIAPHSLTAYHRLVMFSFGFQQAYQRGLQPTDHIFFTKARPEPVGGRRADGFCSVWSLPRLCCGV
jgi:hypothetical protein